MCTVKTLVSTLVELTGTSRIRIAQGTTFVRSFVSETVVQRARASLAKIASWVWISPSYSDPSSDRGSSSLDYLGLLLSVGYVCMIRVRPALLLSLPWISLQSPLFCFTSCCSDIFWCLRRLLTLYFQTQQVLVAFFVILIATCKIRKGSLRHDIGRAPSFVVSPVWGSLRLATIT